MFSDGKLCCPSLLDHFFINAATYLLTDL